MSGHMLRELYFIYRSQAVVVMHFGGVNHKEASVYLCIVLHLLWLKRGQLKKNKGWLAGLSKDAGREETEELSCIHA